MSLSRQIVVFSKNFPFLIMRVNKLKFVYSLISLGVYLVLMTILGVWGHFATPSLVGIRLCGKKTCLN